MVNMANFMRLDEVEGSPEDKKGLVQLRRFGLSKSQQIQSCKNERKRV
jgi:hypothetical protein